MFVQIICNMYEVLFKKDMLYSEGIAAVQFAYALVHK